MSKPTTKWKDRGFDDKQHYAGWLYFNDLADDCKMHDDVYLDPYTGRVVNVVSQGHDSELDSEVDEAEEYLASITRKQQEKI